MGRICSLERYPVMQVLADLPEVAEALSALAKYYHLDRERLANAVLYTFVRHATPSLTLISRSDVEVPLKQLDQENSCSTRLLSLPGKSP